MVKGLQMYADPPSSFRIDKNSHLKLSWEMVNDDGERVRVFHFMGLTPSDWRWKENSLKSLKRTFRKLNISKEVTDI